MSKSPTRKAIDGVTPISRTQTRPLRRSTPAPTPISVAIAPGKQFSEVIDVSRPLRVAKNHESRLVFYSRLARQNNTVASRPQRTRLKHAVSVEDLSRLTFAHDLAASSNKGQASASHGDLNTVQRLRKSYLQHKTGRRIKRLKSGRILTKRP